MVARIISSIIGIAIFLWLCFWGPLPWAVGATIVAAVSLVEFARGEQSAPDAQQGVAALHGHAPKYVNNTLLVVGLAWPLAAYELDLKYPEASTLYALALSFIVAAFCLVVSHFMRTGRALGRLHRVYGCIGVGYCGLLFSGLVLLRDIHGRISVPPFHTADRGAWIMLYVAACVWMCDTGAYFGGKQFGKHKLAPTLSPGKTIEGAAAGLLAAVLTGVLFGIWIRLPLIHGLAIGAIAGTAGPLGDLFESALKREIGIKDFGSVMPGHGGALDRFDSLLFVMPLAYLYLTLIAGAG